MNISKTKSGTIAWRASLYVVLLVITTALSLGLIANEQISTRAAAPPDGAAVLAEASTAAVALNSYAPIVGRVAPAVVTIRSEGRVRAAEQHPFLDDPRLREFFGGRIPQQPREQRRSGLGSGVIVSSDGYILTNHHVINGAERIKVQLTDNRTLDAKIVGSDAPSDLAVLKVEAKDLPVLALGDSDQVRVGDVALAVGNPLGIGQTVTSGIISAKGRSTGLSDGSFEDFLQTDAPINQGNSGGALVSTAGELIGINSQILSPSGGNIGIGFAIPSNMAKGVMDQLVKTGKVQRGVLGESEESHRRIVETASEGIWMIDAEARTSFVNRRMTEMLGCSREEMLDKSSFNFIFEEDRAAATQEFDDKKRGDNRPFDFRLRRKDNRPLWARISTSSIFDEGGKLLGVLGMFTDITERRAVEEERARLLISEREAREEAETANRAKDEFLATVSHDLRTPLASMLMWIRMLGSGKLDAETTAHAHQTLISNVKSLSQLIDDLLDVSRITAGKLRINTRPVELVPIVEAAIDVVRPAAEAKNISVKTRLDHAARQVAGDPDRLQQVLWNLLSNAIKFTPPEESVEVRLEYTDTIARIAVIDTGVGISEEFLPRVFERLYQVSNVSEQRGLGLGLAIVRRLVEMHGGTVQAESRGEGQGATFILELPLLAFITTESDAVRNAGAS